MAHAEATTRLYMQPACLFSASRQSCTLPEPYATPAGGAQYPGWQLQSTLAITTMAGCQSWLAAETLTLLIVDRPPDGCGEA
jgi:hypothetical protein